MPPSLWADCQFIFEKLIFSLKLKVLSGSYRFSRHIFLSVMAAGALKVPDSPFDTGKPPAPTFHIDAIFCE